MLNPKLAQYISLIVDGTLIHVEIFLRSK